MDEQNSDLVVRRRGRLMAVVAVAAAAVSVGYLWRYGQTGSGVGLLVALVLGFIAIGHALAWRSAHDPMLVADDTGLRVRLGSEWTGLPWSAVNRVEVDGRGWVRDGHVTVVPDEMTSIVHVSRRSRWAAAWNRQLHDASLVVPYGLTAAVSATDPVTGGSTDIATGLERLAAGRAVVEVIDWVDDVTEPTVEVTPAGSTELSKHTKHAEGAEADPAHGGATAVETSQDATEDPAVEPATPAVAAARPRRRLFPARGLPNGATSAAVSSLSSRPVRRAEVTMPARPQPATMGGLALSEPQVAELPEIDELRRVPGPGADGDDDRVEAGEGNIALIIDATTDMSARAMQKVRRIGPATAGSADGRSGATAVAVRPDRAAPGPNGTVLGGMVAEGRRTLGLSVDELADRTRIRPYVIESIEVDDFSPCGGDFYARGHLRMLARVLGIDAAPLLAAYDEHFATSPINAREVFEVELATGTTGMVRGGESGANWGALVAAVLVLVLVWGVARYFTDSSSAAPAGSPVGAATKNARGLGSPGAGNPAPADKLMAHVTVSAVGGKSKVVAKDRFDEVVFSGVLTAGSSKKLSGESPLRLMAADGGVVRLSVRGKPLGPIGQPGTPARERVTASQPPEQPGG